MPLLVRLWLLVGIAVLPALAILIYNGQDLRDAREAQAHEDVLLHARAAADQLERVVEGARDLLVTISHAPAVRDADWPSCNSYLAELGDVSGAYARLTVADRSGRIVCASAPVPAALSMADRPHFRETLARQQFNIGSFAVGRVSGDPLLPLAAPFHDREGQIAGIVVVGLRLDWLTREIGQKALPHDGVLFVADSTGTILTKSVNPERWIGQKINAQWHALLEAATPGTTSGVGVDGVHRIYGYIPPVASPSGLHVVAGIGTAQVFKAIEAASDRGLSLVAFAGFLALIAALLGGQYFIQRPIDRLLAATAELEGSNFSRRVGAGLGAGFGGLGQAFDAMAEKLVARTGALRASEARFQRLSELTLEGVAIHDGECVVEANAAAARLFGYAPDEVIGRPVMAFVAPEARPQALANVRAGLEAPYESIGLRKDGARFPVEFCGRTIEHDGLPMRVVTTRDLTAHNHAQERLKLLMAEVDHRSKNMLALVLALVRTTRAETAQDFTKAIQGRIQALARAHALLASNRWAGADLRRLVEEELAPFRIGGDARVRIVGPHVSLAPTAAQSLAMALHELATNAVKHGALSQPSGRVEVAWTLGAERLELRWAETGGPPVSLPARRGMGTTVIERSVRHQLDGHARLEWAATGLACDLFIPADKLAQKPRDAAIST